VWSRELGIWEKRFATRSLAMLLVGFVVDAQCYR
jgi:hypothetical protein